MGYFHEGSAMGALGACGCGPRCGCASCQQSRSLGEHYSEGDGESPRLRGFGFAGLGEPAAVTVNPITRDFKVVVKSYIAPIGSRTGSPYCGGLLNPTANLKLRALATVTDAAFSENPVTDAKDKRYRLYSARTFSVTCRGGAIVSVAPSSIDTDSGQECIPRTSACLQAPALTLTSVTAGLTSPTVFEFGWRAKGRPNLGAEPGMQMVCPRTSVYIWHFVRGRIECAGGEPTLTLRLTGSEFPSHRAFVNGVIRPPTIAQGPFSNLWVAAGISDPLTVR